MLKAARPRRVVFVNLGTSRRIARHVLRAWGAHCAQARSREARGARFAASRHLLSKHLRVTASFELWVRVACSAQFFPESD